MGNVSKIELVLTRIFINDCRVLELLRSENEMQARSRKVVKVKPK
jgi:hypothetical protein